jgi:hypothetical protein
MINSCGGQTRGIHVNGWNSAERKKRCVMKELKRKSRNFSFSFVTGITDINS